MASRLPINLFSPLIATFLNRLDSTKKISLSGLIGTTKLRCYGQFLPPTKVGSLEGRTIAKAAGTALRKKNSSVHQWSQWSGDV
ncbi:hypothetical protein FKM82_026701 [Ascaphus truei]